MLNLKYKIDKIIVFFPVVTFYYQFCRVVGMWSTGMLSTYPQLEPVYPVVNYVVRNERNSYPQVHRPEMVISTH